MVERSVAPELDGDGDRIGARRLRRAFRLVVAVCVAFSATLWFAERYLRYDLAESQYMAALTLAPESARAILRQVVKRDAQEREFPTPKYTAALAEREESDLVLPTYEAAYKLDPNNGFLAIRYGCRLFLSDKYKEARDRFREAAQLMPGNALAGYLEAAALAMTSPGEDAMSSSLALVARTNEGAEEVRFPEPLWSAAMPDGGVWYDNLQRQIVDDCCAPLYRYANQVTGVAERRIALKDFQNWDSWLTTVQRMGEKVASGQEHTTAPQLIAGIHIQLTALEQREAIAFVEKGAADGRLVEKRTELKSALGLLNRFEDSRDARVAIEKSQYLFPLRKCWQGLLILTSAYALSYFLARIGRAKRQGWAISHPRWARWAMFGVHAFLLALLAAMCLLQTTYSPGASTENVSSAAGLGVAFHVLGGLWLSAILLLVVCGIFYPFLVISGNAEEHASQAPVETSGEKPNARTAIRRSRLSLARRYFGIQTGLFLCVIAIWAMGYRVTAKTYPWQVELLETTLHDEERLVINQALSLFTPTR